MQPAGYPHEEPPVCAGYLAAMPQVIEAVRARHWREKGALREFYDGQPLTELAKHCIDLVDGEMHAVEQHRIRKSANKE